MSEFQFEGYVDGDAADLALVGQLSAALTESDARPVFEADDVAVYRDGSVVDGRDLGPRPYRRRGSTTLTTPASFAEFIDRAAVAETALYADRDGDRVVAVFNDHPAVGDNSSDDTQAIAGRRDHTAVLTLVRHPDFRAWTGKNAAQMTQRTFGEFVDEMAHTIREPAAAEMLEVATTLTMKRTLDFESRVRLDNGEVQFTFAEDTNARAGRANSVEIPTSFTIEVPIWEGTPAVRLEARLRFRAEREGVAFVFKLVRVEDAMEAAFTTLLEAIKEDIPEGVPIFHGSI